MAFSKGASERPENGLFRAHPSPHEDHPFPTFTSPLSPLRNLNGRVNANMGREGDARATLPRRFTTNAVPQLSPLGQQRRQAAESKDYMSPAFKKMTPTEKKARQYEELLAQQRRIQAQMAMIDPETRREVDEHQRLEQDITSFTSGHQSEPTTPPEYYSTLMHSGRFSTASLASPPGLHVRPNRAGSQLTSPQTTFVRPFTSHTPSTNPSKSVPASRRGSDEEEEDLAYGFTDINHRAAANLNRNSMPVKMADLSSMLGAVNTTSFLFGDEDDHRPTRQGQATTSPDAKTYLQMHTDNANFPILVRREGDANGNMQLSASSAALDLALSQSPGPDSQSKADRATAARHRQSLPPSAMRQAAHIGGEGAMSPRNGILTDLSKNNGANRRSLEVKFSGIDDVPKRPGLLNGGGNGVPKMQSSYSTNDIPTLRSTNAGDFANDFQPNAVQSPHHDLASPDRQGAALNLRGAVGPVRGQELRPAPVKQEDQGNAFLAQRSALHANATPFGPVTSTSMDGSAPTPPSMSPYGGSPYYGGYGMQMLNNGFGNMYLGGAQHPWPTQVNGQMGAQANTQMNNGPMGERLGQVPAYPGIFGGYSQFPQPAAARYPEGQGRGQRGRQNGEDHARYANTKLESLVGEIYTLCKDQHGCRFLQKKLEDRDPEHIQLIFEEIAPHVVELMTDPFGNYLCQKMLEFANDEQRTILIRNSAPQMVKIALNQHGTRALQKMIEFINKPEQVQTIIEALRFEVVNLIQDLNGNHVIQKCLNHLTPQDAQFIFDAVGSNCIIVGTHRHGCCVLQRCIDHASGAQKGQLIEHITAAAYSLVQDPFGNYVVQYILDLDEPSFSQPLCRGFIGSVTTLSRQKFSSNVMEKCIRTAEPEIKRALIDEIMNPAELDKLLRDSFANYVVQTAIDYADAETKTRLIDSIRPILPAIRHTPYGRRVQGKIQEYDSRLTGESLSPSSQTLSPGQLSQSSFPGSGYGSPGNGYTNAPGAYSPGSALGSPSAPRGLGGASINTMLAQASPSGNTFAQGFRAVGRASRPAHVNRF